MRFYDHRNREVMSSGSQKAAYELIRGAVHPNIVSDRFRNAPQARQKQSNAPAVWLALRSCSSARCLAGRCYRRQRIEPA